MKVLQICSKVPWPPRDGGCVAMTGLYKLLNLCQFNVRLLAAETPKHPLEKGYTDYPKDFQTEFIDTRIKPLPAVNNLLFSSQSYNTSRFYDIKFLELIRKTFYEFSPDLVVLDSLFVTPYFDFIRAHSHAKVFYRAHNVEYRIWEGRAAAANFLPAKWYFKKMSARIKKEEINICGKVDAVLAISQADAQQLKSICNSGNIFTLPFTLDTAQYRCINEKTTSDIGFLGSMDWKPNLDGLNWFMKNVWPLIKARRPGTTLHIAGRNMPESYFKIDDPCITCTGMVDDAVSFICSSGIIIVPVFDGGGIKIKLMESMALAKPVVTNVHGTEGLNDDLAEAVYCTDRADKFAGFVCNLLSDPALCKQKGELNQKLIKENHDHAVAAKYLQELVQQLSLGL